MGNLKASVWLSYISTCLRHGCEKLGSDWLRFILWIFIKALGISLFHPCFKKKWSLDVYYDSTFRGRTQLVWINSLYWGKDELNYIHVSITVWKIHIPEENRLKIIPTDNSKFFFSISHTLKPKWKYSLSRMLLFNEICPWRVQKKIFSWIMHIPSIHHGIK